MRLSLQKASMGSVPLVFREKAEGHIRDQNTISWGQDEMLKGFMIMPEQIVRQLELLKIVKAWDPDELQMRTEMGVASGIEIFGRYFLIPLQGWGGWRGLGSMADVVAKYKQ